VTSPVASDPSRSQATVLVVDDDEVMSDLLRRMLELTAFMVVTVSARSALCVGCRTR
jgi:DNA-binding NtrC family response regulator